MVSSRLAYLEAAGCAAVLLGIAGLVDGDAYMVYPEPYSRSDLHGVGCYDTGNGLTSDCPGPCDTPAAASEAVTPLVFERGQNATVKWATNGNTGGFVQLSLLKRSNDLTDEMTKSSFYTPNTIRSFVCFEPYSRCEVSSSLTYTDSNGAVHKSTVCTTTVPLDIGMDDGMWTLQWMWFGGYSEAAKKGMGDHFSCANIEVNGGYKFPDSIVNTPTFQGGDRLFPGQQRCVYYNARKAFQCVYEPCANSTWTGDNQPWGNIPDYSLLEYIDPVPVPTASSTPQGSQTSEATVSESSDLALTLVLGVGLPFLAIAMVVSALWYTKTHPLPSTGATKAVTASTQVLRPTETSAAIFNGSEGNV